MAITTPARPEIAWLPFAAALVAIPVAYVGAGLVDAWWFAAVAVPAALLLLDASRSLTGRIRSIAIAGLTFVATATILIFLIADAIRILDHIEFPPQWDLQWFWIQGRVAAEGVNFYDFARSHEIARTMFDADANFLAELYFWYPPPTMLLFLPLGFFDVHLAVALWYAAIGVAMAAGIVLMQRQFFRDAGWLGGLVAAMLIIAARPAVQTIISGQTNFLVLVLLLLIWMDRDRPRAGVWTAIGIFVKPVVGIVGLFLVLRGRWRAIGVAIASVAVVGIVTVAAFGPTTVLSYFTDAPTARVPDYLYSQEVNQSLLGTLLRLLQVDTSGGSPVLNPLFVNVAIVVLVVSVWLLLRRDVVSDRHALALCIPLGLMLYPATLDHYLISLMVPIGYLWTCRDQVRFGAVGVAALASAVLALMAFDFGYRSFLATLLMWTVLAAIGLIRIAWKTWAPETSTALAQIDGDDRRRVLPST